MACLSVLDDGIFIVCANPIFPISEPDTGIFNFEVLEVDSVMLKTRKGKVEFYGVDGTVPFFGVITEIEPYQSTHSALALMREKPTLRVSLTIHKPKSERPQ
jgi:hypothetical protein